MVTHGHNQPEIVDAIRETAGRLDQVIFAGLTAAAEAALFSFSKARADRLVAEGVPGAQRVRRRRCRHRGR